MGPDEPDMVVVVTADTHHQGVPCSLALAPLFHLGLLVASQAGSMLRRSGLALLGSPESRAARLQRRTTRRFSVSVAQRGFELVNTDIARQMLSAPPGSAPSPLAPFPLV